MTVLVGVLATDGAVIAADRAVTFGPVPSLHTISDRMQKVFCIEPSTIVAGTGQVGMAQRFARVVEEFSRNLGSIKKPAPSTPPKTPSLQQQQQAALQAQVDVFSSQLANLQRQLHHVSPAHQVAEQVVHQGRLKDGAYMGTAFSQLMNLELGRTQATKGQFGALAAYVADGRPHLCEFGTADFQPELKNENGWYSSMGSGQILADPYLAFMRRTFWRDGQPNIEEAIFTTVWVIHHAIEAAPGLIAHPIDIAVLKKWNGADFTSRILADEEREEHLNTVRAADEHLIAFRRAAEAPPMPSAPAPLDVPPEDQPKSSI